MAQAKEILMHRKVIVMSKSAKHPGFRAVQAKVAKSEGISSSRAGAIIAASSRGASKAAHKANSRLSKVKGK